MDSTVANALSTSVSQTATTETENAIMGFLMVIFGLVAAYIALRAGGARMGLTDYKGPPGGRKEASAIFVRLLLIAVVGSILVLHVKYNCKKKVKGLVPGLLPGLRWWELQLRWCKEPDLEVRARGVVWTSFAAAIAITLLDFMDKSSTKVAAQGVTMGSWLAGVAYWGQDKEGREKWQPHIIVGMAVLAVAGVTYVVVGGRRKKVQVQAPAATAATTPSTPSITPGAV